MSSSHKKISDLCAAQNLVDADLFLVSQKVQNEDNYISRRLSASELWAEISARFVTYNKDELTADKGKLSGDRHNSFAYALSADVSSATELGTKFNTLSTYGQIRN